MIAISAHQNPEDFVDKIATTITQPERYCYRKKQHRLIFFHSFASDVQPWSMCRVEIALEEDNDTARANEVTNADMSDNPQEIRAWVMSSYHMPAKVNKLSDLIGSD